MSRSKAIPPEERLVLTWVHAESLERLKDAIAGAQGENPQITLRWAISRGMRLVRQELEEHYHDGEEFPVREAEGLPRGRRRVPPGRSRFRTVE